MEKKPITPLAAGLVIGLTSVVLFLVYYFTGLSYDPGFQKWIPAIVYAVLIIVFISMWSNAKNNFVTFGDCFGFGFKTVCISTLIIFGFTLLFIYLVPDYKVHMLQMMKDQARQNQQGASEEQIETGMNFVRDHFNLLIIGGGIFMNVLFGLISALVGSAIAKKKPVTPFTQTTHTGEPQS